jgi:hypothetical protein
MYYATHESQIWAANLDGSNPQTIATTAPTVTWSEVRDMAVYSGILYWTGSDGGSSAMAMYQVSIPALTTRPPQPPRSCSRSAGLIWRWARSDSTQAAASQRSQRTGNARVLAGLRSGDGLLSVRVRPSSST